MNLSNTWFLLTCGSEKFAVNSDFVIGVEELRDSDCIRADSELNEFRGIYNIIGINLVVIDSRSILGQETADFKRISLIKKADGLIADINAELDSIETDIFYEEERNIPKFSESEIYKLITDLGNSASNKSNIKNLSVKATTCLSIIDRMASSLNDNKHSRSDKEEKLELIRKMVSKDLTSTINALVKAVNDSIVENCVIIKHKTKVYGLAVDKIDAVTVQLEVTPKFSEYKAIAGYGKYRDTEYKVFNIKYLTNVVKDINKKNKIKV